MVDISDMFFIVGHVGHIWRSWETKLFETITKSKVFETNTTTFSRTIFFRSLLRHFFRLNIFETDTETFFRDQNFWDRDRYSQKIKKSFETEKSRDEMSHSAALCLYGMLFFPSLLSAWRGVSIWNVSNSDQSLFCNRYQKQPSLYTEI